MIWGFAWKKPISLWHTALALDSIVKQLQNAKNKNNALYINILRFNKILCVIAVPTDSY